MPRRLDGAALREAMIRFHEALQTHRDEINSLNVYPVPDGDTGTNMLLTQQAVRDELAALGDADLGSVAEAVARASLMGARGNSGVILAQAMRGFVGALEEAGVGGRGLARALEAAASEAYRAVARPARGTVLDVLADAASAAEGAAEAGDAGDVAAAALRGARDSLAATADVLPELRQAGVVDAGGRGILLFFDALHAALTGSEMVERVGAMGPVGQPGPASRQDDLPSTAFRWEVQFLLDAPDDEVASLRHELERIGDSLVVVGGGGTWKVHVHTNDPDGATALARGAGTPASVEITDLEGDVERCRAGQARGIRTAEEEQATALVAVADGDGLERILSSLGAEVVRGGPGNNPSVGELLAAVDAAPSGAVLLLPDHENVLPAARRAAEESRKRVLVVPTLSVPQGVAAAAAFNPTAGLEENAEALREAVDGCAWASVATAIRDADTPAGAVREGDAVGFVAGEAVTVGSDTAAVALELVRRLVEPRHEILTIFAGAEIDDDDLLALEKLLREEHPDLEIEAHRGDQPGSPYLIGIE
ncbi:MAG: DAK2 domain-containing protein [Actinomycetota bacterium]